MSHRHLTLARLGVLAALMLSGCVTTRAQDADRTFERSVALEPGGRLTLSTTRGSVRLTSWDQPTVDVRARIEPPTNVTADYAQRAMAGVAIEVSGGGGAVDIRTDFSRVPYEFFFGRSLPHVHYEVRAPRHLNLDLDVARSDVTVSGFDGRLALDLSRGNLQASDLAGHLALGLSREDDVQVDGMKGTLDLRLSRSDARLSDVQMTGNSRVEVSRGSVDVAWDRAQALTVDGDLSRSDISSDLPMAVERHGATFHATMNGGGPTLRVSASRSALRFR